MWEHGLNFHPLRDEVGQGLRFNGRSWDKVDGLSAQLDSPFCDPACGLLIVKYVSERKGCDHADAMSLEVVTELARIEQYCIK